MNNVEHWLRRASAINQAHEVAEVPATEDNYMLRDNLTTAHGPNRTNRHVRCLVAIWGKADMSRIGHFGRD